MKSANTMRRMGRWGQRALGAAMLLTLGACVITPPPGTVINGPGPVRAAPIAVEGNWAPEDGRALATFQNGAFINRDIETGRSFTSGGRYNYTGPQRVAVSYTSIIRGVNVNLNCLVVNPSRMNCTTADGNQFSLFRRA